jgi:hypothetical protein
MGYYLLSSADHPDEGIPVGLYVWNQTFNGGLRAQSFNCTNGLMPDLSSPVRQFVPVYGSDHCMLDLHQPDGLGHPHGLLRVIFRWPSRLHCTKTAGTGTNIAQDHKSSCSGTPAFSHIGTITALTDGVQFIFIYQPAYFFVFFPVRKLYAEPVGLLIVRGSGRYQRKVNHDAKLIILTAVRT